MNDVRRRKFEGAVWIPLRAILEIEECGDKGTAGYREEFFRAGSIAVFDDRREQANELGWMNAGINHNHGAYVQDGRYLPPDVYESRPGEAIGLHLVLAQHINRDEPREWHLHQDLVIALQLKRERDIWVAPNEGYIEVARLRRRGDGTPILLEVRSEQLKDYLCARKMSLYIASYRSRCETFEEASHIHWRDNPEVRAEGGDRWEGRIAPIHEGGMPYGTSTAVYHVSRKDVDSEEDVPSFDLPTDDQVESRSWTTTSEGRKLYRVSGELWRNEWIAPADRSPRVRGDDLPPQVFFITDSSGKLESKDTLTAGSRWLWFRPDVIPALIRYRGGALAWYTRDTGSVRCSPDYDLHFGVNRIGLVNVYAKDIGLLPEWQQRAWAGHNVGPEGGVSEELLASQMRAEPAETQAPEAFLPRGLALLNAVTAKKLGFLLFRPHEHYEQLLSVTHRFRAVDQQGFFGLAKDLARLTADSIDTGAIQKLVVPPKGEKWGSLKSLEHLLATQAGAPDARALLSPLVGIYELRHADAHLPGSALADAMRLAQVDASLSFLFQGYQLLRICVDTLFRIVEVLDKFDALLVGEWRL